MTYVKIFLKPKKTIICVKLSFLGFKKTIKTKGLKNQKSIHAFTEPADSRL